MTKINWRSADIRFDNLAISENFKVRGGKLLICYIFILKAVLATKGNVIELARNLLTT